MFNLQTLSLLAQGTGGAYNAGRIAGMIFLVVLVGAVVWQYVIKRK